MANDTKLSKSKLLYVIREKNGKIDNSDIFLLKSVCTICDKVKVILCGEFQLDDISCVFQGFCNEIVVKGSIETDYNVLAEEILSHESDGYEELLFLNNSVFGPFYPLRQIVDSMRKRKYDFWGLTKAGEIVTEQWEYFPKHLQLYFFAIEKKMLHSQELYDFFQKGKLEKLFEYEFTSYMEKCGFHWGTYINIPRYDSNSVTKNFNLLYEISFNLIKEYGFPFLKKDYFTKKDFLNSNAMDLRHAVDFLAEQNIYDINLLWDCVLRKYNIGQIKDSMNLNFILSSDNDGEVSLSEEDYIKTAIIMHLAYQESIDEVIDYVLEIPEKIKKFL